ncbi:MAG: SDR family oxidoreductase [Candidatus Saccharibacteria bacterium]|nr:SDR family oxidoreductase [Pseudorhodobacter sp.]
MPRFSDRIAIVTGGASGIGADVVRRVVSEGGKVAIWDLSVPQSLSPDVVALSVDVSDYASVRAAMMQTIDALGDPDILVASAGVTGPNETVETYDVTAWNRVINVNLNGVFHCNKAVIPAMKRNGYGRIVNVASVAGKEGNPNASAYSASKAGVIGLTKSLGKELAALPITVNCVTPAAVRTPIFDQMKPEHIAYMLSKIPQGRFGDIAEITALICWMASEECSFTTGAVFDASGGRATY